MGRPLNRGSATDYAALEPLFCTFSEPLTSFGECWYDRGTSWGLFPSPWALWTLLGPVLGTFFWTCANISSEQILFLPEWVFWPGMGLLVCGPQVSQLAWTSSPTSQYVICIAVYIGYIQVQSTLKIAYRPRVTSGHKIVLNRIGSHLCSQNIKLWIQNQ